MLPAAPRSCCRSGLKWPSIPKGCGCLYMIYGVTLLLSFIPVLFVIKGCSRNYPPGGGHRHFFVLWGGEGVLLAVCPRGGGGVTCPGGGGVWKKMLPPPKDNFWNSPKKQVQCRVHETWKGNAADFWCGNCARYEMDVAYVHKLALASC